MRKRGARAPSGAQTEHLWPDETYGPWLIVLRWDEIDGRPECVGLDMSRIHQDQPLVVESDHEASYFTYLTGSALRRLPLADLIARDRAELAPPVEAVGGMRKSAADRLRLAAEVYRDAAAEGGKPTKAVAERFGISSGGASNLVARARAAGLLPPTSRGKATG